MNVDNFSGKSVLLLTYYFAPCNYVAANRPNSFVKELIEYGNKVVVVTRHWNGNEQIWTDYLKENKEKISVEKNDNLMIHRLPYIASRFSSNKFISKIQTLSRLLFGQINHDINYYQFKKYISNLIEVEKFDFILVTMPPINALRTAAELSEEYQLKLFVDVRDFENHIVLNKSHKIDLLSKIKHQITLHHTTKWFRNASLIFTVNPPITKFIQSLTSKPVITIMNGFHDNLLHIKEEQYPEFHISLLGSVYDIPEFDELLDGFKLLYKEAFSRNIMVQFIGTVLSDRLLERIKVCIPVNNLIIKERMPQIAAQKEAAKSQLLLVLGFKYMKAVLGTKAFEYMGLRKPFIQMPGDEDLLQEIILKCNAGYCPATATEFVNTVKNIYDEWKTSGTIFYKGDIEMIKNYSRENQLKLMLTYLN